MNLELPGTRTVTERLVPLCSVARARMTRPMGIEAAGVHEFRGEAA